MDSFWRALAERGWLQAEQFLAPGLRALQPGDDWVVWQGDDRPRQARMAWVAALRGGEPQVSLRFEVEMEVGKNSWISRCAETDLRLMHDNWFVDRLPVMESGRCQP